MAAVVGSWTGRETALLRSALRLSMRAFAEHLGVATRTVAKWEAKGAQIRPLPDMQAMLDTALNLAGDEVSERFTATLEQAPRALTVVEAANPAPAPVLAAASASAAAPADDCGHDCHDRPHDRPVDRVEERPDELSSRLAWAGAALDAELVALFEQQTQSYRLLDRRLGARQLLAQTEGHVLQMAEVLAYSRVGRHRSALAAALAEAAALAGWQALDLGQPDRAWSLHETARAAAAQSGDSAVIAHVCAQQAYALLDVDRPADAVDQVRHARETAGTRIPSILRAWLWAAEAEAIAGTGCQDGVRAAIDHAVHLIDDQDTEEVPYLALDQMHLIRWRGHCLARLGVADAIADLSLALETLDPSFVRAAAGLHCDLAIAHGARGETDIARGHAELATRLADATMSIRQQRRIRLLAAS
jgi:transcriptional regulator with XRE-family HTH domain